MENGLEQILIELVGNAPVSVLLLYLWYRCAQERRESQKAHLEDLRKQSDE